MTNLQRFAGVNARHGDLFGDRSGATKNITGKLFKVNYHTFGRLMMVSTIQAEPTRKTFTT